MKSKMITSFLVISFLTGTLANAQGKELLGRILGGVVGGALCNELGVGGGSGRLWAVGLCAIGGSMIGGEIGENMDEADGRAYMEVQEASFRGDLNRDYDWDGRRYGSRTGIRGRVRPIGSGYHSRTREECREYTSITYQGRATTEKKSIICRRSDGAFYSLNERSLYINGRLVQQDTTVRTGGVRNPPPPPMPMPDVVTPGRRMPPPPVLVPDYRGRRNSRCEGWNMDDVRQGYTVYTRSLQAGRFQGVDRSGKFVGMTIQGRMVNLPIQNVAITGCSYGMKSGRDVSTRAGNQGRIAGIFINGDVLVEFRNNRMQIFRQDEIYY